MAMFSVHNLYNSSITYITYMFYFYIYVRFKNYLTSINIDKSITQ
jgi:hypothetical protein